MFRVASMVAADGRFDSACTAPTGTDIEMANVDAVDVDVQIVLLKCCGVENVTWFQDIANALGGRESEGFGKVEPKLAGIKPGQTVYLSDVVQFGWGDSVKGSLLVFAYEAGTLTTTTPPGGNPKLILVNSRTYSLGTNAENNPTTFGTQVPGLPYDYIDPAQTTAGYGHAESTGLTRERRLPYGGAGQRFRPVDDPVCDAHLNAADGTLISEQSVALVPLAMDQYDKAIITLFGKTAEDNITGATMKVAIDTYVTGAQDPTPALIAYVTRMDNATNDPVYLEQAFTKELPWDCIFNGNCTATATGLGLGAVRGGRSHLRPPVPRLVR
jgi:hypothetical protein